MQAYRFALDPTARQVQELLSHAGGARFAYNTMLAAVKANLDQRAAERSYGIGEADLTPWHGVVVSGAAQRFRTGASTLSRCAPTARPGGRRTLKRCMQTPAGRYRRHCRTGLPRAGVPRNGPRMGFPRFKTKTGAVKKFSFTTGAIRVERDRHHITLPRLGAIRTQNPPASWPAGSPSGSARILKATVRFERGRWLVSLTCLVAARLRSSGPCEIRRNGRGDRRRREGPAVVADTDGNELARHRAPRELKRADQTMRALQRKAARQVGPWDTDDPCTKRQPSHGLAAHPSATSGACMHGWPTCGPTDSTNSPPDSPKPTTVIGSETLAGEEHDGRWRGT